MRMRLFLARRDNDDDACGVVVQTNMAWALSLRLSSHRTRVTTCGCVVLV